MVLELDPRACFSGRFGAEHPFPGTRRPAPRGAASRHPPVNEPCGAHLLIPGRGVVLGELFPNLFLSLPGRTNLQDQAGWLRGELQSCSSGRGHTMGLALRLAASPSSPSTRPEPCSLCPFGKFKAIFTAFKFSAKGLAQSRASPARDGAIPESCSC